MSYRLIFTLIILTILSVISASIVKNNNKIIFHNANINISRYEITEANTDDNLRKFKDLKLLRFNKYFKIKIGDRILDQLICESTDKGGKICSRYGFMNVTCFNLNYEKENAPVFECEFINMKFSNKNIIVSNIEINCAKMPDDSHFEEPCGLVYQLLKANGYDKKDDRQHYGESVVHSSPRFLLLIVIIIIALSLSICVFLAYKKRSS